MPIVSETNLITKNDCDKKVNIMSDKIDKLSKDLVDFKIEIIREITGVPEKMSGKFASKLTERIVYTMVGLILISFMTSVIYLVIK